MITRSVSSWAEMRARLQEIQDNYSKTVTDGVESRRLILFRGLADSAWHLETTLERQSKQPWTVRSYYAKIHYCASQIESFLGTSWDLGKDPDSDVNASFSIGRFAPPHPEYWAYLRHHGFPSPLLDWTESPYIALFFALCDHTTAIEASLYVYIEPPANCRARIATAPMITTLSPYWRTDIRHYLQQSYYTLATKTIEEGHRKEYIFLPHEEVDAKGNNAEDILMKIKFPRQIRCEILTYLDTHNINFYSLFQTEDALVKSLALKLLELPNLANQ